MENVTAQMIHSDFNYTSGLITEKFKNTSGARRKAMREKSKRLKNLGFNKSAEVREYEILEDALTSIREFSPYRFITEEAVESICKKYGLLFGNSGRYLGEIPEKNLRDIEAFEAYQKEKDAKKYNSDAMKINSDDSFSASLYGMMMQETWLPRRTGIDSNFPSARIFPSFSGLFNTKYHIAAPINMMQHDEDEVKDGYKIMDDPIVFKQVPGGYLIITAWGPEAQHPKVFNRIQN